VADDNADAAASLAIPLRAMGHEVHTADDGQAALACSDTLRPDLILLDIGMPKISGYEGCKAIRSQRWSVETRLVALSGWGEEGHKARAREAGFDHYLVKPVSLEALERLLASLPAR
jgi:DNA-binding response OmpR family regulator